MRNTGFICEHISDCVHVHVRFMVVTWVAEGGKSFISHFSTKVLELIFSATSKLASGTWQVQYAGSK